MTIGTDPEFFVLNKEGKPVPAWRYFPPATDKQKVKLPSYADAGCYFRDGYALELNTPAESCRGQFGNKLGGVLRAAFKTLPNGYSLTTAATVTIDKADMKDAPADCQVFGCDPSFDAYTGEETSVDLDPFSHLERYSGGHLHYGCMISEYATQKHPNQHFMATPEDRFKFIKLCDLFIGAPLAYLFDTEDEVKRRKYYGKAGECRMPKYTSTSHGMEYRTPSSKIYNSYNLASMFLGVMRQLVYSYGSLAPHWSKTWEKPLQHAINTCEVPFSMLQTVSGFYTPELLKQLKTEKVFEKFTFYKDEGDCHTAFSEFIHGNHTPPTYHRLLGHVQASWGGLAASGQVQFGNVA